MELEVEVLNGLCYCRFRSEAIGGCGVQWRTAGLRRGRARLWRIRIGELMDTRVGSYFRFLFRDARLRGVKAYWGEIFTRRKLYTYLSTDHVMITCANSSSPPFLVSSHTSTSPIYSFLNTSFPFQRSHHNCYVADTGPQPYKRKGHQISLSHAISCIQY
jgi:hypothetical protein